MSIKERYKQLKENPTLKRARVEFIKNIGEIKKRETPIKYNESKFERRLSNLKRGIDIQFGYQKPTVEKVEVKKIKNKKVKRRNKK